VNNSAGDKYPFNVEALLRSKGEFKSLLDIDEIIQRNDLSDDEKSDMIGRAIKTVIAGRTAHGQ